ncbi:MAG: hypothetical protein IJI46_03555 [Erysipelotrichaceae bacterium]|nr:hypothetical protein [Erysipelotrichaceae bacterium]
MDIEKTKKYYEQLSDEEVCDCTYCQNYVKQIKATYPKLAAYLDEMGVNIEKPFEAIPIAEAEGVMLYSGVQYVVMGKAEDFKDTSIENSEIFITDSHPMTGISEDHFVIEIAPIELKWIMKKVI